MSKIINNVTDLIGNTPLMELCKLSKLNNCKSTILAKLEFLNPGGSIKDRIALSMIEDAEKKGLINENTTIIEPTSGNTGIGLSCVAASKGYKVILTMPDTMSIERRTLLKAYGAEVVLTPGDLGMQGSIDKANELAKEIGDAFIPQQFCNLSNVQAHKLKTAEEIWEATDGNIDFFIAGVGSGGTLTGVAQCLKEKNPNIKIVAVEPASSPLLSGGKSAPHKLQGLGANFIPEILDMSLIDEIIPVSNDDAYKMTREIAQIEGLLVGISSGAVMHAALSLGKKFKDKTIVTIFADSGERYLSVPNLFK